MLLIHVLNGLTHPGEIKHSVEVLEMVGRRRWLTFLKKCSETYCIIFSVRCVVKASCQKVSTEFYCSKASCQKVSSALYCSKAFCQKVSAAFYCSVASSLCSKIDIRVYNRQHGGVYCMGGGGLAGQESVLTVVFWCLFLYTDTESKPGLAPEKNIRREGASNRHTLR